MSKAVKKGIEPRLRFPEFKKAGDWEERLLGDIAEITTGGKDTQNKVDDGKYPFFVRSQVVERIDTYSYDGEAILTSGDGVGVGKNFHYINGKFDFHQRVYCIYEFKKDIVGRYVFHYFSEHFLKRVSRLSAKNSVDSVRRPMITDMPIGIPNKKEQQKIADCLSSLDEVITAQGEKVEALKTYKKGLLQQLFPQEGQTTPTLRFPEFKKSGDWEEKSFSEMFQLGSGKDYKHLNAGDVPVYGSGGYMLSVDQFLYDGESACIGRKGTIDKPLFLTGKFWTVDTLFYTHSFNECLPKFIFYIFQTVEWLKHNEAGGVPSLSKEIINKIKKYIPTSIDEQKKIVDCLSSLDNFVALEIEKLKSFKDHKKGLLQQLFPSLTEAADE